MNKIKNRKTTADFEFCQYCIKYVLYTHFELCYVKKPHTKAHFFILSGTKAESSTTRAIRILVAAPVTSAVVAHPVAGLSARAGLSGRAAAA